LEKFAEKHKSEIKKDVAFRKEFQEMCATVGVDPLACKSLIFILYIYNILFIQLVKVFGHKFLVLVIFIMN
jgi:ESCRT-II complex subunit VPS22